MSARLAILGSLCLLLAGCSLIPEISRQPTYHNPFPQISKVAVAPVFNVSQEKTLDGRRVAQAYAAELQAIPGFEVVPVGVVEAAMRENKLELNCAEDARRLAQALDVDAVVIGAVTDFSPYYPPRLALQVEWYAANPAFHPIPPGYGLPWGTPEADDIPGPLVFEAEFALAKAQMKTQAPPLGPPGDAASPIDSTTRRHSKPPRSGPITEPEVPGVPIPPEWQAGTAGVKRTAYQEPVPPGTLAPPEPAPLAVGGAPSSLAVSPTTPSMAGGYPPPGFPPDWPDPRGFIPAPPRVGVPPCIPNSRPILRHTHIYHGHDADFTESLSSYYYFRNDARFGGWQGYLQRSDDFIRFCCHRHVVEMLSARGGAGETRVVWRWPVDR